MSTALARQGTSLPAVTGSVELHGIADVFALSEQLSKAQGFVPRAYVGKPEAIAACILTGLELGMGPMEAMRSIHVVDGKPTMSADLMLGRAIRAGVRPQWLRQDAQVAHVKLTRDGFAPHEHRFTIEEAAKAGLTGKDNWKKYPAAMLRARCVSAALRAFAPDVLGSGVYVADEVEDAEIVEEPQGNPLGASSLRSDPTVIEQGDRFQQLKAESRALREQMAPDVEKLLESGTLEELQAWCFHNGGTYTHELRGGDQDWVLRRLRKKADKLNVTWTELGDWLTGRTPKHDDSIPDEYAAMFDELETQQDPHSFREWVQAYREDLGKLKNGQRRAAWKLITEAAATLEIDEDEVRGWLT